MNAHAVARRQAGSNVPRSWASVVAAAMVLMPAALGQRTFEQNIQPGQVAPAASGSKSAPFDAAAAPMHPGFPYNPPPAPPPNPLSLLSRFTEAYAEAGSPRVAILYNRSFANTIAAWSMDARATLVLPVAAAGRPGFDSESLQWSFEEGFLKPFLAAGVRVVDPALVTQTAIRDQKSKAHLHAAELNANEINANVSALKEHADWLVEVLLIPDVKTAAGYQFRTTLKRLSDGRVLASGVANLDPSPGAPERTKVVYDTTGYHLVPDASPRPTLDDYAQSVAVQLLVDLAAKLPALVKP